MPSYYSSERVKKLMLIHREGACCNGHPDVKDCNDPPGVVAIVYCTECECEVGDVVLN